MKEKKIIVKREDTLLNVLSESLKDISNKKIKSFIKYKMVEVDGKVEKNSSRLVSSKNEVRIVFSKGVIDDVDIDIIYEDQDIIVINKPAGLLTISNRKEKERTAFRIVSNYVKKNNKNAKIFVVHRLDQGTSGVLMFAKSEKIKKMFQDNWGDLVKTREYYAVVEGRTKMSGTIESYLTMNHFQIVHSTKNKEGAWYAKTNYEVVRQNAKYSFLRVDIETGRRNQIRVHMSEDGHPIVGDGKYGSHKNPIGRLALHASKLVLIDPRSNELLTFSCDIPKEIESLVK